MNIVPVASSLRDLALEKIARRDLPQPCQLGGVGRAGSGQRCCLCDRQIQKYREEKNNFEYDVVWHKGGRTSLLRFHSDCFSAWVSTVATLEAQGEAGTTGHSGNDGSAV